MPRPTRMITHLLYEDLFRTVPKGSLGIPVEGLRNLDLLKEILADLMRDFEPLDAICFSSFLNMICQTGISQEKLLALNRLEITGSGLSRNPPVNKLLYHRDNLLYFIAEILRLKVTGDKKITGTNNRRHAQTYYRSLMLISSLISRIGGDARHTVLKDYFLRDYPYYYIPETACHIFSRRLRRYEFIYKDLLPSLETIRKDRLVEAIAILKQSSNVSLEDYFHVAKEIWGWFLQFPLLRGSNPDAKAPNFGFDSKNLSSFYIRRNNFKDDPAFMATIEHLSRDIDQLAKAMQSERRDKIGGFYEYFQLFFDHPVFRINADEFCIIDLRFFLEGVCAGFFWHLNRVVGAKDPGMKHQYGYLLEQYFTYLIKKVFPEAQMTSRDDGMPDAIVESSDSVIIFEFTTEYYRFASLFNTDIHGAVDDLHRLFFNAGDSDARGRGKKDRGKFLKMNSYIERFKESKKEITPVIVTESYIGDYDLLNQFRSVLDKGIEEKDLQNLQLFKPLLMNLDDLEAFWGYSHPDSAGATYTAFVRNWETADKGPFHYNFSYFMADNSAGGIQNEEYKEFFNVKECFSK